jgi:hypothetical protein
MDVSGDHDGRHQWQWTTASQWAAGQQSNHNGQSDSVGAMDGTLGGRQLPPTQKRCNGRQREMDGIGNHNGRWWQYCNGPQQQQRAVAVQWAAGQQSNWDGQWDGGGTIDGTMGSRQLPPTQKGRNGRQCKMDGSGNHNDWQHRDCDGQWQWQRATAMQWVVGWQSYCNGHVDSGDAMDSTMGSKQLPPKQKRCSGRRCKMDSSSKHDGLQRHD